VILALPSLALAAPPCPVPMAPAAAVQVSLTTHGHQTGGLGIVAIDGTSWSLSLLAPAGFELFTVSGPPDTVTTGLDAWRPWLERLPVERDLHLLFTPIAADEACRAETSEGAAHLRSRAAGAGRVRRWRGAGGGATATVEGSRLTLVDRRRGYTLTLIVAPPEPDAPR
jgi:hypothetical protein